MQQKMTFIIKRRCSCEGFNESKKTYPHPSDRQFKFFTKKENKEMNNNIKYFLGKNSKRRSTINSPSRSLCI
jgi:hypothetical protein